MNKLIKIVYVFLIAFLFALTSCGEQEAKTCIISCDDISLAIGETFNLEPQTDATNPNFIYKVDGNSVQINNGVISAVDLGTSKVTISVKGYEGSKEILITVAETGITLTGENKVVIENEIELQIHFYGVDSDSKITWKSSDNNIARVAQGKVTGIDFGKVTITAKCEDYQASFEVEVIRPDITAIKASNELKFDANASYEINYNVEPFYASSEIKIEASNDCVKVGEDNSITTLKTGDCVLTLISKQDENVKTQINVKVLANEAPKFEEMSDYIEKVEITYGKEYDLLSGLRAIDNADGDITSKVTFDETLVYAYGEHIITLSVEDLAGNVTTIDRIVNTSWPYHTKFIGHSGSYYGVPNTEEAFLYAASVLHYQALECDLHMTKDGVFVTNHDSYLTTKNEQGEDIKVTITQTNYADLVKYELTSGKYTGHVCTLERYLEICKTYGCEAIIELKTTTGISDSSQANMPTLCDFIKAHGMWDKTIFLTYSKPIMTWIRNKYKDVGIQYLVQGGDDDTVFEFCKKYNCMLSVNVTYGQGISDAYIKKYHDAGIKISTWTFSGKYSQVQEWIDKGVEYVTCDIHVMEQLDLK